jgi:hypothetical protein
VPKEERALRIHFVDGSTLVASFPEQRENQFAREIMAEEILKRRMLTIEADGALHFIPFDNIKYFSLYPAPQQPEKFVIQGATFDG